MKLFSYFNRDVSEALGICINDRFYDLAETAKLCEQSLPGKMQDFLDHFPGHFEKALKVEEFLMNGGEAKALGTKDLRLLSPVPHPNSLRDAYAFRQHVEAARRNRGLPMVPEFDQFPVFYYSNHRAVIGEGEVPVEIDHLQQLDFELEIAAVIGVSGKNLRAEEAQKNIAGFMIMNDFSARRLQAEEMKLNMGPAKGKDFATALGPYLVTLDELDKYASLGRRGSTYNLKMMAYHNGRQVSSGNMKDMHWTFAEVIERISYGTMLYPGDVIGTGTVGTGCFFELNGNAEMKSKEAGRQPLPETWLRDGDEIELEVTGLGILKNKIVKAAKDYSILEKKRKA